MLVAIGDRLFTHMDEVQVVPRTGGFSPDGLREPAYIAAIGRMLNQMEDLQGKGSE